MTRKTRKAMTASEKPFFVFYDDAQASWINRLAEQVPELAHFYRERKRWEIPKRVYLQFSTKDATKEEYRNAVIRKRKAKRNSCG